MFPLLPRSQGLGQVIENALDGGIDIGRMEVIILLLQNMDEVGAEHAASIESGVPKPRTVHYPTLSATRHVKLKPLKFR